MKNFLIVFLTVLLTLPAFILAGSVDKTRFIHQEAYPVDADLNQFNSSQPPIPLKDFSFRGGTDDPFLVGTTWYDFANYGSLTKTIVLDDMGNIHFNWTNGTTFGSGLRHIYYNFYNTAAQTWLAPQTGNQCWAAVRSGFTCMDVTSDNRGVVACHSNISGMNEYPTTVGVDYGSGWGAFLYATIPSPVVSDTVIWPHMAVDINDVIYVFSRMHPSSQPAEEDWTELYYSFSDNIGTSFSQFVFADTVNVPSFTVATSRISGRAAFGYHQFLGDYLDYGPWSGYLAGQLYNDAYAIMKEDGQDWDWANPVNITNCIVGDSTLLPDSMAARGDTWHAYLDIDLMFDNEDVLHAMFTCRAMWEAPWDTVPPPIDGYTQASTIWHWREDTDSLNVVAHGYWSSWDTTAATLGCGAWKSTICRPSMGIDDGGNIYCAYELYHDGEDPDTRDIAMNGYANADVYATVSTDGGYNWAEPVNITNTRSDSAIAGECFSEVFPSLAEKVDDYLHIFYLEDKDAGSYVFETATASTENPMWYEAIDKTEIPTTPLIEQIYFHDPLEPPPPVGVERVNNNQPVDFAFRGNYPNPFNPSTRFDFSLKKEMEISLKVYDIQGRLVKELAKGVYSPGEHSVEWNAPEASSGIYFCRLTAGGNTRTVKAILLK